MVRYEDFRLNNSYLYDCKPFGLQDVKGVFSCTFPDNPDNGRITIMKIGNWNNFVTLLQIDALIANI